jgi:hypothetical protein
VLGAADRGHACLILATVPELFRDGHAEGSAVVEIGLLGSKGEGGEGTGS